MRGEEIGFLLLVLPNAWQDLRKEEILPVFTIGMGVIGYFFRILNSFLCTGFFQIWSEELLLCLVPGSLLLMAAMCSREQIGYGDGIFLLAAGAYADFQALMGMLLIGMLFLLVGALLLRRKELPLLPFLLIGHLLLLVSGTDW